MHKAGIVGRQRGVSLFGLLFWGVLIAFVGVVGARVVPTVIEYAAIKRVIAKVARDNPPTVGAARAAFEQSKSVEYGIGITGNDLVVSKENERLKISFAYDRVIELGGPAYLLIKYEGQATSGAGS